jgi:hypothetical protein
MSRPDGTTPILSISKRDAFRILVCGLHVLGSIVAAVFCFLCDAQKSRQIATVPFALPLSVSPLRNMSHARASRTAFPWGEDDGEPGHLWNPFLLVLAFEWLTACYAMCNLTSLFKHILWPAMGWLATGLAIVITWFALNSGALGVSLPIVLVWAFVTTAVLCIRFDRLRPSITAPIAPVAPVVVPSIMDGRIWLIPKTIAGLKVTGRAIFTPNTLNSEQQEYERVTGVLNRYAEYCVTAPLLFLAVTCLLVPDAPSWYARAASDSRAARLTRLLAGCSSQGSCSYWDAISSG